MKDNSIPLSGISIIFTLSLFLYIAEFFTFFQCSIGILNSNLPVAHHYGHFVLKFTLKVLCHAYGLIQEGSYDLSYEKDNISYSN